MFISVPAGRNILQGCLFALIWPGEQSFSYLGWPPAFGWVNFTTTLSSCIVTGLWTNIDEVDYLVLRKKKLIFPPVRGAVLHQPHDPIGSDKQTGKCWDDSVAKKISSLQHSFIWCHVMIVGLQSIHLEVVSSRITIFSKFWIPGHPHDEIWDQVH